ncbi:hypothetical protein TorRG33x02_211330 [Trema orientale]|uniref:Uncharacterized protein n=1 Tax=Trema orientale TaxID=63057 RepID=A0A2P5EBY6_TREOI|nr:hypothetical protein TorRG33x02_211330 [Trema orientale]
MIAQTITGYQRHAVTTNIGDCNTNESGTDGVALSKTTMALEAMMDIALLT